MIIGVPKERKTLEKRVAVTPDSAAEIIAHGHKVLIETGAGVGSMFSDERYKAVGCTIVPTLAEVWQNADMIVKVKEPHEDEYKFFRKGLVIFDYLHLASMPELAKIMVDSGVIGIAYELVRSEDGRLPLLDPMSVIAGKLSVLNGSYYLLSQNGGRGVLLSGTAGVPARNVVIVGAGVAGTAACEAALGAGARVTILDKNIRQLEKIHNLFGSAPKTVLSSKRTLERECPKADLLIGAVLVPGAHAPVIITRNMIASMQNGAVFVDISIDQGGCAETSRPTDLQNPTFVEEGVIHYGVCNMPAQTPRTSTLALTTATLPYILKIADVGVEAAIRKYPDIRDAVNTYNGYLTNKAVSESVSIDYTSIDTLV